MGKKNLAVNQLLERKEIFADLINGTIYEGRQVLSAEDLELMSGQSGVFYESEEGRKIALERRGDVRMRADFGTYSVILANEAQDKVHYAMPVRNMLYDALEYTKQIQNLEKKHLEAGAALSGDEFLSGIMKEDRLMPVITTVLYCKENWDGARSLYEMMGLKDDENSRILKEYLPDYKLNLIDLDSIENPERFRSSLQQIFGMIKLKKQKEKLYQYIKDHQNELKRFDSVEMTAALILLGEQKRLGKKINGGRKKGDETDVCQAIDELIEDGEKRGEERGIQRGEERMAQLSKRLIKDKRYQDLEKASDNNEYRQRLFREYGL